MFLDFLSNQSECVHQLGVRVWKCMQTTGDTQSIPKIVNQDAAIHYMNVYVYNTLLMQHPRACYVETVRWKWRLHVAKAIFAVTAHGLCKLTTTKILGARKIMNLFDPWFWKWLHCLVSYTSLEKLLTSPFCCLNFLLQEHRGCKSRWALSLGLIVLRNTAGKPLISGRLLV